MEPLNSGDRPLVHCREVVPISEVMPCMLQSVGGSLVRLQCICRACLSTFKLRHCAAFLVNQEEHVI